MTEPDLRNIVGDGQNKDCEPMEVIWQEDYSMMVPVCPKCKELAYENEYCVFCGQPFKVHYGAVVHRNTVTFSDRSC